MKNIKNLSIISTGAITFLTLSQSVFASGNSTGSFCPTGIGKTLCNLSIGTAIGSLISFLFIVAAIIALLFLIIGGIRWVTSGGDKSNIEAARDSIIAAIVGLVIIFLSYVILNVVLHFLFGIDLLNNGFTIPTITGQ